MEAEGSLPYSQKAKQTPCQLTYENKIGHDYFFPLPWRRAFLNLQSLFCHDCRHYIFGKKL